MSHEDRNRERHIRLIQTIYTDIKLDWIDGYPQGYKHRYRLVKDLLSTAITLLSALPDNDDAIANEMETIVDTLQGSELFPNPNAG